MSSSQNEAGIAIEAREAGKRTTRNSQGLRRQLFADNNKTSVSQKNTSSKPKAHWDNTCFGRFSITERQEELVAGSPHSAVKLKLWGIDLRSSPVKENEKNEESIATPPRQIRDILQLQLHGSPVRIQMKRIPPSPYAQSYYPDPKQPSPGTIHRAQKIQAPQNEAKVCEADITLQSLKAGKENSRTIPYSAFKGISAQTLNTLYGNPEYRKIRKEYLHGIDRASNGKANEANLFAASRDANSQMMPLDDAKKQFLEEGLCEQVHSTVKSTLQKKTDGSELTHIADEIEIAHYVDNTGLKISAVIDGNTTERPSVQERKMIIDFLIRVQKALLAQQTKIQRMPQIDTPNATEEINPSEYSSLADSVATISDSLLYHSIDVNIALPDQSLSDSVATHSDEYSLYSLVDDSLVFDSLSDDILFNDGLLDCSIDTEDPTEGLQESTILITLQLEHSDLLEEPNASLYQDQDLLYGSVEFDFDQDSLLDSADMAYDNHSLYHSVDTQHLLEAEPAQKSQTFETFADGADENACPNPGSNCSFFGTNSPLKKRAKISSEPNKIYQPPSISL